MESFQTPLKKKVNDFHSQIRNEQLSQMKTVIRAITYLTSIKQAQNDQFNSLCQRIYVDCTDREAIQEMKKMYKEEEFIIKQSNGRKLKFVIKEFLKRSELQSFEDRNKDIQYQFGRYIRKEKLESIQKYFKELLFLLTQNAYKYPKFGCFDGPQLLEAIFEVLKKTRHQQIRSQTLRLVIAISQNIITKKYLLSDKRLSILSDQKFLNDDILIQKLLASILNFTGFKLSLQRIDQLSILFESHKEKLYQQMNEDTIDQINIFIRCITQKIIYEVKKNDKFVSIMFFILKKCLKIEGEKNQLMYAKIVKTIIDTINQNQIKDQEGKNCLMKHHQKFQKIYYQKVKEYQRVIDELSQYCIERELQKDLRRTQQQCQIIINSFMTLFGFIYRSFPQVQQVRVNGEQLLIHFLSEFNKGSYRRKMTQLQFRFFVRYYNKFEDKDMRVLIEWFYQFLQDKESRIQCLKKLSNAVRNQIISQQEFKRISQMYEQKTEQVDGYFDRLSYYILNEQPIPTLQEIQFEEKLIKQRRQQIQREQMEEQRRYQQFLNQ